MLAARRSGLAARCSEVLCESGVPSSELRVREAVADAADGVDVAGFAAARLQTPSDPLHERVDAAHCHERAAAPHLGEQRVAAEHASRMAGEQIQQLKFLLGDLDVAARDAYAPAVGID